MRLLYVSSGKKTLSDLNPSIVNSFKQLQKDLKNFAFQSFFTEKEQIKRLMVEGERFKPDIIVVFGQDAHNITKVLKRFSVPIGLWVVNDPYRITDYENKVKAYDFVITEESSCVPFYKQKLNTASIHCPLAVNPNNYRPMDKIKDNQFDLCFVGNATPSRLAFFDKVIPSLNKNKLILIGQGWRKLKTYQKAKTSILNKIIQPSETAKYYNQSKIVLNIHRGDDDMNKNPYKLPAHTPNNRTFDIAACKAFQLTDCRKDLNDFYELNKEIVCFKGEQDFVKKAEYYLKNAKERKEIAKQAYKRTMNDHTYYQRFHVLIDKLQKQILNG